MVGEPNQSRHVFYTGYVQGVGFRYTTRQIAERYAVTGFVRNLPDGRVELLADGAPAELTGFLSEVASTMEHCIHDIQIESGPADGKFSSFEISF
jgi:acylphosphatase